MAAWLNSQPNTPGPLLHRLTKLAELSDTERKLVASIEQKPRRSHAIYSRLRHDGSEGALCIQSGWAALVRELSDGRRQIIRLLLPGDLLRLDPERDLSDAGTVAMLGQVKTVDATDLRAALQPGGRYPGLASVIKRIGRDEDHFMVASLLRVGRQTAYERLANLILELNYRLNACGEVTGGAFSLPLKQETIADCLGLSVVHVNRTLQLMRRAGVIEMAHGSMRLLDIKALEASAEFQPPGRSTHA